MFVALDLNQTLAVLQRVCANFQHVDFLSPQISGEGKHKVWKENQFCKYCSIFDNYGGTLVLADRSGAEG